VDVGGLFGKEVKKALFAREEALQKSRHVSDSPLRSPWLKQGECKRWTERRQPQRAYAIARPGASRAER
jgi:hypothetical protein